jgi:serine/threonine protein kinase
LSYIKSALEIALEKSKKIDKLSPEEMNEIKQQERIDNILANYYKDQIESDDLWQHLKDVPNQFLIMAQNNFLQSLTFQSNDYEFKKRKDGILAIENLKKNNQSANIELYLEQLKNTQDEFQKNKEQVLKNLREELEKDPQKRLQTVQQGNQIVVKQLSLEEALEQNQQLKQKLNQLEEQFKRKFNMVKEKLIEIVNE